MKHTNNFYWHSLLWLLLVGLILGNFLLGRYSALREVRALQDKINHFTTVCETYIPPEYDALHAFETVEANCTFFEADQYQYELSKLLGYL